MGKVKGWLVITAAFFFVLTLFLGLIYVSIGYSISEMDWNRDGQTSLDELADALDIKRRSVLQAGVVCQEYFRLKDGLPVRVDCPRA